jgi:hypothetical protein
MVRRITFLLILLAVCACAVAVAPPVVDFTAAVIAAVAWSRWSFVSP